MDTTIGKQRNSVKKIFKIDSRKRDPKRTLWNESVIELYMVCLSF